LPVGLRGAYIRVSRIDKFWWVLLGKLADEEIVRLPKNQVFPRSLTPFS